MVVSYYVGVGSLGKVFLNAESSFQPWDTYFYLYISTYKNKENEKVSVDDQCKHELCFTNHDNHNMGTQCWDRWHWLCSMFCYFELFMMLLPITFPLIQALQLHTYSTTVTLQSPGWFERMTLTSGFSPVLTWLNSAVAFCFVFHKNARETKLLWFGYKMFPTSSQAWVPGPQPLAMF